MKKIFTLDNNPIAFEYLFQVLEDVTEFETTAEGRKITKLEQILLNGNNITMLVPGGDGPDEA